MNKRTFALKKLEEWKQILHLGAWKVTLKNSKRLPLDEQNVVWGKSEMTAQITLNLENQTLVQIEHSLAHELFHLILAGENRVFDQVVFSYVSKNAHADYGEQYNLVQNEVIEHWLRIIYELLDRPYPPHDAAENGKYDK